MTKYDAVDLAFGLGDALRRLRAERGWSQSSLAEAARTTQPVVARLEVGGAVPTVAVLQRLARAMGGRLEVGFREEDEVGFREEDEVGFQGEDEVGFPPARMVVVKGGGEGGGDD